MIPWTEGIADLHRRVMRKIVTNVKEYQFLSELENGQEQRAG